jgi:hypothetical protein
MVVAHLMSYGLDLMNQMGRSNLDNWCGSGQLGLDWGGGASGGRVIGPSGSAPWLPVELASERTGAR